MNHDPACQHDGCICQPLTHARRGERMVVRHLQGTQEDCLRLREMGFHESAEVKVVCAHPTVLAQVQGARVCLSERMASAVLVAAAS